MSNECCEVIASTYALPGCPDGVDKLWVSSYSAPLSVVGNRRLYMALDRLDALETRIKDLVKLVQELKKRNAGLEDDLRLARQRLADESDSNRRWARERTDIKTRIEKVLSDIEVLESFEERKEVAFD
jgi:septal ring factor EnvC (AmiA/AmiB activator)